MDAKQIREIRRAVASDCTSRSEPESDSDYDSAEEEYRTAYWDPSRDAYESDTSWESMSSMGYWSSDDSDIDASDIPDDPAV